jgi:hypothetical protein
LDDLAVTLDGGCGRGGPLVCGGFSASGKLSELVVTGGRGALESVPYEREAANDFHVGEERIRAVPAPAPVYANDRYASA